MHFASDYIYPYRSAGGHRPQCRVRIYLSKDARDSPLVICSELPINSGGSVTNFAEVIAAEVVRSHELATPWHGSSTGLRLWWAHWSPASMVGS